MTLGCIKINIFAYADDAIFFRPTKEKSKLIYIEVSKVKLPNWAKI